MLGTSQIIFAMLLTLWSFNLYVVQKQVVLMGNMVFKTQDMGSVMSYKHHLLWNPRLREAGAGSSNLLTPTNKYGGLFPDGSSPLLHLRQSSLRSCMLETSRDKARPPEGVCR